MQNDIVFKTFKTFSNLYVYDRHTNAIYKISDEEYQELYSVELGMIPPSESSVIKDFQDTGILLPNVVKKIEHNSSIIVEQYIDTRCQQLTLQVTQQCNLRCNYCAYSGSYKHNRTHSSKRMSLITAKQAIDFFLEHNSELPEVVIGFYGGEPLLEFNLIKECVKYAISKTEGKTVRFNMTTNGTLITDEVADFLVHNNVMLSISLDGAKKEHDYNRKFINGEGTFDVIIENINKMRNRYPEYDKSITISTTVNPHTDLRCVLEYFSTDEVFNDRSIIFNTMSEIGYSSDIPFIQQYYIARNYEYMKMLFSLVGKLDSKYVSPLFNKTKDELKRKLASINNRELMRTIAHYGGPCLPGVMRLYVRTDGVLFPCERINEMINYYSIGTLENGFDIEKIRNLLNIGQHVSIPCHSEPPVRDLRATIPAK